MKATKNIARLAATASLTAALSIGGVMAPVAMAFAEGTATAANSITIKQSDGNKDTNKTKFVGYLIFTADVVGDADKTASNVQWAVDRDIQVQIITAILDSEGYGTSNEQLPSTGLTAQDVACWLDANIQDAETVDNDSLLNKIASVVKTAGPVAPRGANSAAFDADAKVSFEKSGYYLFLTDEESIGKKDSTNGRKQTGTSPIFTVVGGGDVVATEKTGIPTVEKKIKDDKPDSNWADKADSQMGQGVQYQLTGTVASNIATFDKYYYEFHDMLSAGLTVKTDSVVVTIYKDKNDTAGTVIGQAGNECKVDCAAQADGKSLLTVTFDDLKAAGVDLAPDSKVVVTYTAHLDPSKAVVVGGAGNENEVKLIYSNNPMGDGKGESVPDTVRDYTYALKIIKQDAAPEATRLDGVRFTIQATDPDDAASMGKYVNSDGVLVDNSYEFTTANGGEIYVKGLDAGTYTVHEVEGSNPGYNTLDDFTFTISTVKQDGTNSLKQDEGQNELTISVSKSNIDLVDEPSVNNGTVTLTVKNKKGSNLPLTGLNGVTFTWISGGAVLCIGVAHLIRSRKRDDGSEE